MDIFSDSRVHYRLLKSISARLICWLFTWISKTYIIFSTTSVVVSRAIFVEAWKPHLYSGVHGIRRKSKSSKSVITSVSRARRLGRVDATHGRNLLVVYVPPLPEFVVFSSGKVLFRDRAQRSANYHAARREKIEILSSPTDFPRVVCHYGSYTRPAVRFVVSLLCIYIPARILWHSPWAKTTRTKRRGKKKKNRREPRTDDNNIIVTPG